MAPSGCWGFLPRLEPQPWPFGRPFMVLDCDSIIIRQVSRIPRIESSVHVGSWLICGIILCKIHPKGVGLAVAGKHTAEPCGLGVPRLLSVCSSAFWLSLMFCIWWKHITCEPGYPVLRWKFLYVLFFSLLNSSHALQQCPSLRREVENFLFVLGGEDQWNPNGNYWTT